MNWKHVQLIFFRELNDQLRDRRTLFTIAILPILLYPLLGLMMMQIAQFSREHRVLVRVVGLENWPSDKPLIDSDNRLAQIRATNDLADLIDFQSMPWPKGSSTVAVRTEAEEAIRRNEVDAVLIVTDSFQDQLNSRLSLHLGSEPTAGGIQPLTPATAENAIQMPETPANEGLVVVANLARDHSQIAQQRVDRILEAWRAEWASHKLAAAGLNPRLVEPLELTRDDTAPTEVKRAMLWSKLLPFVMLVWALTGAFYPAVDLCAGEKERGTLETLLSSPARRREIVWGKLLTITCFSIGTAILNLLSMQLTAGLVVRKLASIGTPQLGEILGPMPIASLGWLGLLLLPMAAFFSALALAVAALARSTKEGQYYLMPLLLITLPLVSLPMLPSLELSLGTSLVPVSGAIFLVRSLIDGRYSDAFVHLPVVLMVTIACCAISLRWAIRQFESEAVMFRDTDRFNFRAWLGHLWRSRGDYASPAEALLCGAITLVGMFFAQFAAGTTIPSWNSIVTSTVVVQIGLILTPCLLMALFLTKSVRKSLRVVRPQKSHLAAATLLGFTLHPMVTYLGRAIESVYEIGPDTKVALAQFQMLLLEQPLWAILLLLAALPALCEELTYRGFIFGGLLRSGGTIRAIVVSALLFGFMHSLLQQSIAACVMGLVLGVIAWRTGTVLCTIIVHFINNSLSLGIAWFSHHELQLPSVFSWAIQNDASGQLQYQSAWITISVALSCSLLFILFQRSPSTEQSVQAEMAGVN